MSRLKETIVSFMVAFAAWATVLFLRLWRTVLELGAFVLVTLGMGMVYKPLLWISAGVFLWIVAAGSNR